MQTLRPIPLVLALLLCGAAHARELPPPAPGTIPPHGVVGVSEAQLSPDYWLARLKQPDRVVLDARAIAAQNDKLFRVDDSMNDLAAYPDALKKEAIVASIGELSVLPDEPVFDVEGKPIAAGTLQNLVRSLDLESVPVVVPTQFGMALKRTAMRRFPTDLRVFSSQGDTDIDRFQESALFPGTPVVVAHRSRDGKWLWVESPNYKAWVHAGDIAMGSKLEVLAHRDKAPYRIVTGAKVATVFANEQPQLSELQLDMGVRVPLAGAASDALVNGQHSYTSWVVELPVRDPQGALAFAPALLQKNQDTAGEYLPLTRANLIRQAFKFLGERYGWGHSYNGRDCSGFVAEVYRSMGVELPRNTSDQRFSPALAHTAFE
ncbi:MAG: SH3 domain-containing protein, partial [Pseudoxanthomonas sp.]